MNISRCSFNRSFEDSLDHVWRVNWSDLSYPVPSPWYDRYHEIGYPYTVAMNPDEGKNTSLALVDTTAGPAFVNPSSLEEAPLVAGNAELFGQFRLPAGVSGENRGTPVDFFDPDRGTLSDYQPTLKVTDVALSRPMPSITGAPDQVAAHTQDGLCGFQEWVSGNPIPALLLLGGVYFIFGGKR